MNIRQNLANRWATYWTSIDWDHIIATFLNKAIILLAISILFFFLYKVGSTLIKKGFEKYNETTPFDPSRIKTLERLILNIYHYTIFFFVCYSVLYLFGIPVGSLIAGAGIAGLAIGLGAQGFINDILTGFFIILERQIEVGDEVTINNLTGTVEAVGLRTTQIKSFDGTLNYIPNRTITIICNANRKQHRVQIDFYVPPTIDIPKAVATLEEESKKHPLDEAIVKDPEVIGFTPLGQGQYALRIHIYVEKGNQDRIQREWTVYYLEALQKANIEILTITIPIPKAPNPNTPIITTPNSTSSASSFLKNNN